MVCPTWATFYRRRRHATSGGRRRALCCVHGHTPLGGPHHCINSCLISRYDDISSCVVAALCRHGVTRQQRGRGAGRGAGRDAALQSKARSRVETTTVPPSARPGPSLSLISFCISVLQNAPRPDASPPLLRNYGISQCHWDPIYIIYYYSV